MRNDIDEKYCALVKKNFLLKSITLTNFFCIIKINTVLLVNQK